METSPKCEKILKKLLAVHDEISIVKKGGYNEYHKYNYSRLIDYLELLTPVLQKHKLIIITTILSVVELSKERVLVNLNLRCVDTDGGEYIQIQSAGEGVDANDKATYKAITGARKYGISMLFNLISGDDPDESKGKVERASASDRIKAAKARKEESKADSKTLDSPDNLAELCKDLEERLEGMGHKEFTKKTLTVSRRKLLGTIAINKATVLQLSGYYNKLTTIINIKQKGE